MNRVCALFLLVSFSLIKIPTWEQRATGINWRRSCWGIVKAGSHRARTVSGHCQEVPRHGISFKHFVQFHIVAVS